MTVNQEELKIREYRRYRSFYCGLCRSLAARYGVRGQMILPYDMVFLNVLLNGLYELPLEEKDIRCLAHPFSKQHMVYNEITDYCADIGLLLAYYKLQDDVEDVKSMKARTAAGLIRKNAEKAAGKWPQKAEAIQDFIRLQSLGEKRDEQNLDEIAGHTGKVLGEIFAWRDDVWADILRRMGFYLGKYVYLLDAYDDLEKDRQKRLYNPWEKISGQVDFDACVENTLTLMMADCAREFEKLPIVQDIEILRNVIYSGVWVKYRAVRQERDNRDTENKK